MTKTSPHTRYHAVVWGLVLFLLPEPLTAREGVPYVHIPSSFDTDSSASLFWDSATRMYPCDVVIDV